VITVATESDAVAIAICKTSIFALFEIGYWRALTATCHDEVRVRFLHKAIRLQITIPFDVAVQGIV
jgi:hypothetical protein